jgi:hypothetical protein
VAQAREDWVKVVQERVAQERVVQAKAEVVKVD